MSTSFLSTLMTYVKNMSNWPDSGGQMMDMTQNDSLWPLKGNFPGKTKNNRSIWICLKYNLSTSLLSTLMTYLENIFNGPGLIQGVKWWIWPKIIHFDRIRVIFLEKLKRTEAYEYAWNVTWVLLFYQLWWHMSKTCQIGLIQGIKWWIWPKMIHFAHIRVIFLEKLKSTEAHEYP